MLIWRTLADLAFLVTAGWLDLKTRRIPIRLILAVLGGAVLADCAACAAQPELLWDYLYAMLPGVFLLLLSWITRGQVGSGDGMCLLVSGLWIGSEKAGLQLFCAAVMSAVYAAGLLIYERVHGKNREKGAEQTIAFVPFLAAGALLSVVPEWF